MLYFQGTLHKEKDQKYFKISFIFQASQTGKDRQSQALGVYKMLVFQLILYLLTFTASKGNSCDTNHNDFAVRQKKLPQQHIQFEDQYDLINNT